VLEWSTPGFLPLLLSLPLLRWLHRRRGLAREIAVAALFLWPKSEVAVGERRVSDGDPRWRRRAALVGALVIAAAGPLLVRRAGRTIDVHVDDVPSLRARESGGTRLELAVQELVRMLRHERADAIRVVSMHEPSRILTLDPRRPDAWSSAIQGWIDVRPRELPMPGSLSDAREHWVVTDGVDPDADNWMRNARISRVVQVGAATENAAITLLAARPHLADPHDLRLVAGVANGGTGATSRRLEVRSGDLLIASHELVLQPGEFASREIDVPGVRGATVRASLVPSDALPDDDELTLDIGAPSTVPIRVDAQCGAHLVRALRSHPAVSIVDGAADVAIACSDAFPAADVPTLWFRSADDRAAGAESTRIGVGDDRHAGAVGPAAIVEVSTDMERAEWVREPSYPAFVADLLDRITGRSLLDPIASRRVPATAIRIAPHVVHAAGIPSRVAPAQSSDLGGLVLACAALLLVLDLVRTRSDR
jgi:hypothetical protein